MCPHLGIGVTALRQIEKQCYLFPGARATSRKKFQLTRKIYTQLVLRSHGGL